MNNVNKVEGGYYGGYNQHLKKESLIIKKMPNEIFDKVFSYLDDVDIQSASRVSRLWRNVALDVAKRKKSFAVRNIANFLSTGVDVESYPQQKNNFQIWFMLVMLSKMSLFWT